MLHMLDVGTLNVTTALKQAGLWENTLLLFSADNGGIGKFGNNYPLRGHKHDPWEGGTRVTAFLAGGFLPAALRGTSSGDKLVHVADWYVLHVVTGLLVVSDSFFYLNRHTWWSVLECAAMCCNVCTIVLFPLTCAQ